MFWPYNSMLLCMCRAIKYIRRLAGYVAISERTRKKRMFFLAHRLRCFFVFFFDKKIVQTSKMCRKKMNWQRDRERERVGGRREATHRTTGTQFLTHIAHLNNTNTRYLNGTSGIFDDLLYIHINSKRRFCRFTLSRPHPHSRLPYPPS